MSEIGDHPDRAGGNLIGRVSDMGNQPPPIGEQAFGKDPTDPFARSCDDCDSNHALGPSACPCANKRSAYLPSKPMPETRPPLDLAGRSLDEIAAAAATRGHPPVERWNPPHCGSSGMRIDREGRWFHDGRRIERDALVRLFASVLRREPDGRHLLVTPVEKLDIEVELAALRIVAMTYEGDGEGRRIAMQVNDGSALILGPDHPLRFVDGLPLVAVRGLLEASLERPVWYELAELALAADPPGVWSSGCFFSFAT
jgi:hypothetical protein